MRYFLLGFLVLGVAGAEPLRFRAVASNLTSGNQQSYSPDNGNHSNPEGAGARILKALKPDIVMIQEFNTTVPVRQWVNQTLGEDYVFMREEGASRAHGNDERIRLDNLVRGSGLLLRIVEEVALVR